MPEDSQPTILITGCSRGLGRAMVRGFEARGARVLGCARSKKVVDEMNAEAGEQRFFQVDVVDDAAVAAFAGDVIAKFGAPDILVNNAALINSPAPLWEVPEQEFSDVIDVNIKGVTNVVRHFTPAMIEKGSGVIVNFSSGWGRSTSSEVAPYCATKFAIEGLTGALAQDLPAGLAAVALNPGVIDTDMLRESWGSAAGGYPKPDQWAESAVPFIAGLGAKDNGGSLSVP